jgi:hypothetical protein
MRYRPASNVPGRKRLSSLDLEEFDTLDGRLPADFEEGPGVAIATVSSESTAAPQMEQKRLFEKISPPHDEHFVMDLVS